MRLLTCGLIVFVSGCETAQEYSLTYKLWDKSQRSSCRPAPAPKLQLFSSARDSDLLVVYDALSERRGLVERRAYYALTNDARIMQRKPPVYVKPSLATDRAAVPIFVTTNGITHQALAARFPVLLLHGPGFELFRDGQSQGAFELPVYDEGMSLPSQVALTPVTLAGDAVMVGAVAAAFGAVIWLMAGAPVER